MEDRVRKLIEDEVRRIYPALGEESLYEYRSSAVAPLALRVIEQSEKIAELRRENTLLQGQIRNYEKILKQAKVE
jgi:hypothetical protein